MKRLIVGVSGSSGVIYGVRLLEVLRELRAVETHLILSRGAALTLRLEMDRAPESVHALADVVHAPDNRAAAVSSGSFPIMGMAVMPCSMNSLAQIALSLNDNLLSRAADVTLKERRRLVLLVRETPFNLAHLRNMTAVTEMGGIVFPPLPAFYHRPGSIDELVADSVERVLALLQLPGAAPKAWQGL